MKFLSWKGLVRGGLLAVLLSVNWGGEAVSARPLDQYSLWLPVVLRPNTNPLRQGEATWYNATGAGSCMFDASPNDLNVAAMNRPDFNTAAACGEYVFVSGPKGTVTVRIVDLCPGCASGDLDLSAEAFAKIANPLQGRVAITWQVVSPELSGPIAYHFKNMSSQYWTAVQIRNHRNPVAKFEYLQGGTTWVVLARTSYNYFIESNGMGPGPYTFRVTDLYGNVLTDSGIPLLDNATANGAAQFPPGP